MLAQLSLETQPAFVTFVVGGSATLFLLNQALTFYKEHIREQPTPANTYATLESHRELKKRVDGLHEALKAQTEDINRRIDLIPGRVISLLTETKRLHGK